MRLNYKRLGDYVEPCNEFNEGMQVKELLGINNIKYFQASHTNTIGIDLQTYRIVRKGQFAYNRATTRNGDKISISLREGNDCIVSPSYRVFKVKDENELSSEFLMMWFRRSEFDRYARFMSHGSAHEFFEWEQMCEVRLPIPNIDKQRELVKEYNTIVNRININNQMIKKLEETTQAIYKQWFVDFEFPDEIGQPYKSNGGEMGWCEELGKEVPKGWVYIELSNLVNTQYGYTETASVLEIGPKFLRITDIAQAQINWKNVPYCKISEKDFEKYRLKSGDILVARTGATAGYGKRMNEKIPRSVFASFLVRLIPNNKICSMYLGFIVESRAYKDFVLANAEGSAQPQANAKLLTSFKVINPLEDILIKLNRIWKPSFGLIEFIQKENETLFDFKNILLSQIAQSK